MRRKSIATTLLLSFFVFHIILHEFFIPSELFKDSLSTVLLDKDGALLGARIAEDGQWRFPSVDTLDQRFVTCLIQYEDRRFYHHLGVDPISIIRAVRKNIKNGGIKEGGSTLTMQLARMARGNQTRTVAQKMIEILWAIDLELNHSKEEILRMYVSHAPFGGNIVGINAATWRYYSRDISCLSWAELATLAVLPNAPALIHPGKNRKLLKQKRDYLLSILLERKVISRNEYELSLEESLPDIPYKIPNDAPHLIDYLSKTKKGDLFHTKIDPRLQRQIQYLADSYCKRYSSSNHVENIAILVMELESGVPIAYVGNTSLKESEASQVDMIQAERSPGSTLKPFLYAAMLSCGEITPRQLFADTPLSINGFSPSNFNHTYSGAVHADDAIVQSLNVPLVRMLSLHTTARFMEDLKWLGMTTLRYNEDHYGASLILGGAEVKLWDLCGMYRKLALKLVRKEVDLPEDRISTSAIWFMVDAMSRLARPEEEAQWTQFKSMKNVAWKTGTSWGSRDAWAVGFTPKYVVGVWTGNATGEGRAGMTGIGYSAPVMFDVFSLLDNVTWFTPVLRDMEIVAICRNSGCIANSHCTLVDSLRVPSSVLKTQPCRYCRLVHLSKDEKWQVNTNCVPSSEIKTVARFVLPAAQEYYYKNSHAHYKPLPPFMQDCLGSNLDQVDIIYPEHGSTIIVPRGFKGLPEKVIFEAVCRNGSSLFWHLDDSYVGETRDEHKISLTPTSGSHTLSVVDEKGNKKVIMFFVK